MNNDPDASVGGAGTTNERPRFPDLEPGAFHCPVIAVYSAGMARITYGPSVDAAQVSRYSLDVLSHILDAAGCESATISSFTRTPRHFAEILHDNCVMHGVAYELSQYLAPGRAVIQVFIDSVHLSREATIDAMEAEVIRQGPEKCSRHCSDPTVLQVFDITDSSLGIHRDAVIAQCHEGHGVSKVLVENNVVHVEVLQPIDVGV